MNIGRLLLKISSILFIFVVLVFLLNNCTLFQNKKAIVADTPSTDLSEENLDGIAIGMKIKDSNFINKHQIKKDDSDSYSLDNDKYSIMTDNEGEIIYISGDETAKTNKGIKVGDPINQAIKKYGKNYYEYTVQGVQTIGYVDHKNKCKIDIWYVDDKVYSIDLSRENVDPIL
ncbi:hypothetical protein [Bacillus sp. V59.32b]|uniref:hypothetical protein n=1 Tax=Bacillus sp. V59.32b TaxID=1758642 RepID=UPI000E3D9C08|nr:hypothetical protein [Bacillus sp. V59.32b]RFU69311.1 hypothetical protein D0463_02775 [Bacillus sp. V59.32b]